jgi:hypothetical protein
MPENLRRLGDPTGEKRPNPPLERCLRRKQSRKEKDEECELHERGVMEEESGVRIQESEVGMQEQERENRGKKQEERRGREKCSRRLPGTSDHRLPAFPF